MATAKPKAQISGIAQDASLCLEKETRKDLTCDLQHLHIKPIEDNRMYSTVQYIPQSRAFNYLALQINSPLQGGWMDIHCLNFPPAVGAGPTRHEFSKDQHPDNLLF